MTTVIKEDAYNKKLIAEELRKSLLLMKLVLALTISDRF